MAFNSLHHPNNMPEISRSTTSPSRQQLSLSFRHRFVEMLSKREHQPKDRAHGAHHLIAGTTAGVVTTAALYPLDLVKTRYQARIWWRWVLGFELKSVTEIFSILACLLLLLSELGVCPLSFKRRQFSTSQLPMDVVSPTPLDTPDTTSK